MGKGTKLSCAGKLSVCFIGPLFLFGAPGTAGYFSAEDRGARGPSVLRPGGARAMGLGGSYVAVADDASALWWNPAGIQRVTQKEMQLMTETLPAEQQRHFLGYVHPTWRNHGRETWGISATLLDVESFDIRHEGQPAGSAQPREWAGGLSFAHPLGGAQWGTTVKYVQMETYQQKGHALNVDLGLMGPGPSKQWTWGLTLANIGPPMRVGERQVEPPVAMRSGVGWTKPIVGKGELLVSGQLDLSLGTPVELRPKEFDLLHAFLKRPGHVLTRAFLTESIWGDQYFGSTRTIDTTLARVRAKLGPFGDRLRSIKGIGYVFDDREG